MPNVMQCVAVHAALLSLAHFVWAQPATARSQDRTPAGVVYDIVIERPLGLAEIASGVAISSVAVPMAATAGKTSTVVDHCVTRPGKKTFTRALGHFPDDRNSLCSPVSFGFEFAQLSLGAALSPLGWLFGSSPFDERSDDGDGLEVSVDANAGRDGATAPANQRADEGLEL